MNELISSFAGKRLAAFGALVAAIALLAGGGAFSLGTAQAQHAATGYDTRGLDHMDSSGDAIQNLKVTLVTGFRHTVCLVDDIAGQRFRADTPDGSAEPAGTAAGSVADIDDLDWEVTNSEVDGIAIATATAAASAGAVGDIATGTTGQVRGPRGVLTAPPSGTPPAIGWNWVIMKKAGTEGSPTVTNPARRFGNGGGDTRDTAEACVYWTSTATGTQIVRLYQGNDLRVSGSRVFDLEFGDATAAALAMADVQLEVTWVDADPAVIVNTVVGTTVSATPVSAPIAKRMVFTGAGYTAAQVAAGPDGLLTADPDRDGDETADNDTGRVIAAGVFEPASGTRVGSDPLQTPDTVVLRVNAFQDPESNDDQLTGASVSFAVTGTCGMVSVPGATGTGVSGGNLTPGLTGAIASWLNAVDITISNTGAGAAACRAASSSTVVTITAGAVSNTITVNWEWDGYGEYTVDDVDDTTKKVTFHTAVPRTYSRSGRPIGWSCDTDSQARSVTFDLDGRASVTGFARRNTVGTDGPTITSVTSRSTGATTPKRTLGATDSECQVSWTVKSPSRAADVYLDITSAGITPSFSQLLNFAPEAEEAATTFDTLDPPLYPGTDQVAWQGESTPVGDAIGDSGALAVYEWVAASQSWVSYFPGSEGLGVNTLTTLRTGGIYTVVTPNN